MSTRLYKRLASIHFESLYCEATMYCFQITIKWHLANFRAVYYLPDGLKTICSPVIFGARLECIGLTF
jgi:hypothetical protein